MKQQTKRKRIKELMKHFYRIHYVIFFLTVCIASLGLLMIEAATYKNSGTYFLKRQLVIVVGGCVMMIMAAYVDVSAILYKLAKPLYVVGIVLISLYMYLILMSYGGSSMLCVMFELAICVSISKKSVI